MTSFWSEILLNRISFFFFLKKKSNTGFVGMKAVVSSSFSEDIPEDWRPTI